MAIAAGIALAAYGAYSQKKAAKQAAKDQKAAIAQQQQLAKDSAAPTIDQASMAAEEQNRLNRRRGRSQYMLRPQGQGLATPVVGTKTLLGS